MPINTSRYRRSVEWDGPKGGSRKPKPIVSSADSWRRRFYILLVVAIVLVLGLAVALGFVLWKHRDTSPKTETSTTETSAVDTASWKKSESAAASLGYSYPSDWKLTTNKTQTDADVLSVQLSGSGNGSSKATVKIDVIKNTSNLSLSNWVKQFGPKDIQTTSATIVSEQALLAKFLDNDTGEEQNVYYVSKNSLIYVFDLYQSGTDDLLKNELTAFTQNISFTSSATTGESSNEETTQPTASTGTEKLVINTTPTTFDDEFSSYKADGTGKALFFSDKEEDVYLKGPAVVSSDGAKLVGFFGKSGSKSLDGLYLYTASTKKLAQIANLSTKKAPEMLAGSADLSIVAYSDGARGVAKSISTISDTSAPDSVSTTTSASAIVDLALSPDGKTLVYALVNSGLVNVVSNGTTQSQELIPSSHVVRVAVAGTAGNYSFAFIADKGSGLSKSSDLYYKTGSSNALRLTNDSAAQDAPHFNADGTKIAYESYTSGTSGKASVWVIGVNGKGDTNIVKSGNNTITGWISE